MTPLSETTPDTTFYQETLDQAPAMIYINQFLHPGDPLSLRNKWSNAYALNYVGITQKEVHDMGFHFFEKILHPEDLEIIKNTSKINNAHIGLTFTFLQRIKHKETSEFNWFYGNGITLEIFANGAPKTSICAVMKISKLMNTENQLVAALKEIGQLKNKLRCSSLTKRERQIINLIAQGFTDKELANKLNISLSTAKTHRNRIIKKLDFKNTASLVAFATECGL